MKIVQSGALVEIGLVDYGSCVSIMPGLKKFILLDNNNIPEKSVQVADLTTGAVRIVDIKMLVIVHNAEVVIKEE